MAYPPTLTTPPLRTAVNPGAGRYAGQTGTAQATPQNKAADPPGNPGAGKYAGQTSVATTAPAAAQNIDPMTGRPYATPTGTRTIFDSPAWLEKMNVGLGDISIPTFSNTPDYSRNYYGMSADGDREIERVGQLPPLDPNAFQMPGYAGIESQAQRLGQRASDMYGSALSQAGRHASNASQSRDLALQALTQPGPSAAQLQLQMGQDNAARQALAMARSGRGLGSGGQLRSATLAGQMGQQQVNQQSAALRAQEEQARRQQLLALGAQDLGALGQAYGQQLGAGQLGLGAVGQQAGLSQAQQQALADRAKTDAAMQAKINETNANFANYEQPAAPNNTWTDVGAATGAAGGLLSGMAALGALFSDRESKMQIRQLKDENQQLSGAFAALTQDPGAMRPRQTREGRAYSQARSAADALGAVPANTYRYRPQFQGQPGGAPGQHVGPMSDDLSRVLPGVVQPGPDGLDRIDPGRLALANASATGELARRLKTLEARS